MSKRLYFTLPDVPLTKTVVLEIIDAGVPRDHLHVVASDFLDLEGLPEAGLLEKSELKHGIEAGIGLGGIAGFLGGLLAVTFPPGGLILGGAALTAGTLAGAGFGAVVAGLVSHDMPSHELEAFEKDIQEGHVLLLVDAPSSTQVETLKGMVLSHHPGADINITDSPKS